MVKKFFEIISGETNGLHRAAFFLGFLALFSQILGLVRDKILAFNFGAGAELDIYYAAFRIPDFIFVSIGSLVSVSVLVPFIIRESALSEESARRYLDSVFSFFFFIITAVSALAFLFIPLLLPRIFPGFESGEIETLVKLARIMLLSPIILGVSNMFGSITQAKNRFIAYGLSPVFYNIGIIAGILFLYPPFGLEGLAIGVVLGAILHVLMLVPAVLSTGLIPRMTLYPALADIRETILVSAPMTISLSMSHIAVLALLSFASLLSAGSIAVFNFAYNLQSISLSIIGMSYSLAVFPALSRAFVSGQKEIFLDKLVETAKHIIFWSLPFMVLFIVLRAHIVRVVLGSGQFDWTDTRLTAAVLALFLISIVFQNLNLLFIRAMYAIGNTKAPLLITFFTGLAILFGASLFTHLFTNFIGFKYFIESILEVSDLSDTQILPLALAFTAGSGLGGLAFWFLTEKYWPGFSRRTLKMFFRTLLSWLVGGVATYTSLRFLDDVFSLNTFFGVFAQGSISGLIGIILGILMLRLLGSDELRDISKALHERFWKTKVIGPDAEVV